MPNRSMAISWLFLLQEWIYVHGSRDSFVGVSRCGLAVRRLAGKQKDLGSIRFGSPFSFLQNLWFTDTA